MCIPPARLFINNLSNKILITVSTTCVERVRYIIICTKQCSICSECVYGSHDFRRNQITRTIYLYTLPTYNLYVLEKLNIKFSEIINIGNGEEQK